MKSKLLIRDYRRGARKENYRQRYQRSIPLFLDILTNGVRYIDSRVKEKTKPVKVCSCGKEYIGAKKYCIDCEDRIAKEQNRSTRDDFFKKLEKQHI